MVSTPSLPNQWIFHKHFDPRYCINHSKFLSKGIFSSLVRREYATISSIRTRIPKTSGGHRNIDAFSIPDAAVAKIFLNSIRTRNAKIFCDLSYAYQNNKTPLDAIIRIKTMLKGNKLFISQYDFSGYFDSIRHEYLDGVLGQHGPFLTTQMERLALGAVMRHQYLEGANNVSNRRDVGIPQGNSLSLLLANAAAHELDTNLAKLNGAFARFADDSVVINYNYEDALKCADVFHHFSECSGVGVVSGIFLAQDWF